MPKKPSPFQQKAALRATRNYQAGGGDTTDFRRSKNPLFDPVTRYPGRSSVGGPNTGLQPTPIEKIANAAAIARRKRT